VEGDRSQPIGVILAGGSGRRIGGAKALVTLRGRPMISYVVAAFRAALADVAVVAKPDTRLPIMAGVSVWRESAEPRHPLVGIVHALREAGGRAIVVGAADMPFVTAEVVRSLAGFDASGAPAVIAVAGGGLQPQLGRYEPSALSLLDPETRRPLREVVAALGPALLELDDPRVVFNVNTPAELAEAERILGT
jgi:molybdopterin-guanine dinucleotide biosynthesis protein A